MTKPEMLMRRVLRAIVFVAVCSLTLGSSSPPPTSVGGTWEALSLVWNLNPLNVPIGSAFTADAFIKSPDYPCLTADDLTFCHRAEVYATLAKNTSATGKSNQNTAIVGDEFCVPCSYYANHHLEGTFSQFNAPGQYYLKLNYNNLTSFGSWHSTATPVFLTRPGVADFVCYSFDVVNEDDVCAGGIANLAFTLVNFGELGASVMAQVYMADDSAMTSNLQYVASIPLGFIPGGGSLAGTTFTPSITMPFFQGAKYFAAKFDVGGVPTYDTYTWSQRDKCVYKADVAFVDGGWYNFTPASTYPAEVASGGIFTFQCKYKNKGNADTLPTTAVQVEIKAQNGGYIPIPGAVFPLSAIPCNSAVQLSPVFSAILQGEFANADDVGKKRSLRLRIIDAGTELAYNNNKSTYYKIIVKQPQLLITGGYSVSAGEEVTLGIEPVTALVDPVYTWTLSSGSEQFGALVNGAGVPVASLQGEVATIKAHPSFTPGSIDVRLAVSVDGLGTFNYGHDLDTIGFDNIQVVYKAFIMCEAIEAPMNWLPGVDNYFLGDDRGYGFRAGSSRTHQEVYFSPAGISLGLSHCDPSATYNASEPGATGSHCEDMCLHIPEGTPVECSEIGGPPPEYPNFETIGVNEWKLTLVTESDPGCADQWWAPEQFVFAIDYEVDLFIRQQVIDGIPQPYEYRVETECDGFPWHELYINGAFIKVNDPCDELTNVLELADDNDYDKYFPSVGWAPIPGL